MDKLKFEARTLDDGMVRDGLCAVAALEDAPISKQQVFLVGGIATQSYLQSPQRRPTSDIDLAVMRPLSYAEFKEFSKEAAAYLQDRRYVVHLSKGHNSYGLTFFDTSTLQAAVIEFARRNPQNFERIRDRLEREYRNARTKLVEERGDSYAVSSPEDIVVPKIVRGIGTLKRHPEFFDELPSDNLLPLTAENIAENLRRIKKFRAEAVIHIGNPELSERLRFESDIYDINLLSRAVGFNPEYLRESMSGWSILGERSDENRKLVGYLFPHLQIG